MAAEQLEHFTIRCSDLDRTRDFYAELLGLTVGPRPNFNFPGYWLYCGGVPVVHLVDGGNASASQEGGHTTGAVDHIAFRCTDVDGVIARLKANGVAFRHNKIPDFRLQQIFVRDADGILIELNFREQAATSS